MQCTWAACPDEGHFCFTLDGVHHVNLCCPHYSTLNQCCAYSASGDGPMPMIVAWMKAISRSRAFAHEVMEDVARGLAT